MTLEIEVRSSGPGMLRHAGGQVLARCSWGQSALPLFHALTMWASIGRLRTGRDGVAVIIRRAS